MTTGRLIIESSTKLSGHATSVLIGTTVLLVGLGAQVTLQLRRRRRRLRRLASRRASTS
jgi:hypothetical protein